jgi:rhodanese-related sulfurtransferase
MVFVCKTDKRSATAAEILRGHGIKHVMVLRGGMEEWSRHAAPSQAIITPI